MEGFEAFEESWPQGSDLRMGPEAARRRIGFVWTTFRWALVMGIATGGH